MALQRFAGLLGLLLTRWSFSTIAVSVSPRLSQQRNETVSQLGNASLERRSQEQVAIAEGECNVCHLKGPDAGLLYVRRRHDSLGDQVMSLIYGMAMAARCGLNFGGAYSTYRKMETSEGVDVLASTADLFSVRPDDISVSVFDLVELIDAKIVHWIDDLPKKVAGQPRTKTFIVQQSIQGVRMKDDSALTTPGFLEALRQQTQPFMQRRLAQGSLLRRSPGRSPVVAIHIWHGNDELKDWLGMWKNWYTPQEWLHTVVGQIRAVLPHAYIHAFAKPVRNKDDTRLVTSFPASLGVQMHSFTGDNMLDAWADMATADVFVMSKTDYSQVAALLNMNCVIFNNFNNNTRQYQNGWIMASEMVEDTEARRLRADLKDCMRERLPHYSLVG